MVGLGSSGCAFLLDSDALAGDASTDGTREGGHALSGDATRDGGLREDGHAPSGDASTDGGPRVDSGPLAYVSGTAAISSANGPTTNLSPALPSTDGLVVGRSLVVVSLQIFNESGDSPISPQVVTSDGWTLVPKASALLPRADSYYDECQLVTFWRWWDGRATYSFTLPEASSYVGWAILAIDGANPANPNPIAYATTATAMPATEFGTEPTMVGPSASANVPQAGGILVAIMTGDEGIPVSGSVPAGFAMPYDGGQGPGYLVNETSQFIAVELLQSQTLVPSITLETQETQSDGLIVLVISGQ
jgi:hypothetical protein